MRNHHIHDGLAKIPMKRICLLFLLGAGVAFAAAPQGGVYDFDHLPAKPQANGTRRDVFDGPTATLARLNCHITTLKVGERSGAPRLHTQEEVIIVKEGQVEAAWDGHAASGGPGSVIFFPAHATTMLRNAGDTPATYIVLNYYPRS
jgi:uncharacterized cupin superfamily protein